MEDKIAYPNFNIIKNNQANAIVDSLTQRAIELLFIKHNIFLN